MKRIAVIGAVLERPHETQQAFNEMVAEYKGIVRGRMGTPFDDDNVAVVALTIVAELDVINALTGKLGRLPGVTVKTAISEKTTA